MTRVGCGMPLARCWVMTMRDPIKELCDIVRQFHHLQQEHEREGMHGSWRRRQGGRLHDLEQHFESLLTYWIAPEDRAKWHEYFYRGGAPPELSLPRALSFKGRSEVGANLEIRRSQHAGQEIVIDGMLVGQLPEDAVIDTPYHFGTSVFHEAFEASAPAIAALRDYARFPGGPPPWQWARALYADGLIDASFALTPRGRRLCESREVDVETVRGGRSRRGHVRAH